MRNKYPESKITYPVCEYDELSEIEKILHNRGWERVRERRECKVTWCTNEVVTGERPRSYCSTHIKYKEYSLNAGVRQYLMYKVEKIHLGHFKCEKCGFDPIATYPNHGLRQLSSLMDVDHIKSSLKHTLEGEHPSNYQLLCKHCHILKSHREGDYINKKYK